MHGFSLIETLVYLGLVSLLITGTLVSAYAVQESAERYQHLAYLEQEGLFIMRRLSWSIQTGTLLLPLQNTTEKELTVRTVSNSTVRYKIEDNHLVEEIEGEPMPLSYLGAENFEVMNEYRASTSKVTLSFTLKSEHGSKWDRTFKEALYVGIP